MEFKKLVVVIATIVMVVMLGIFAMSMSGSSGSSENWPPVVSDCPDYWAIRGTSEKQTCVNMRNLGTCPAGSGDSHLTMNFNLPAFTGDNEMCSKYTWANKCGVTWDGITYGVSNPCDDDTEVE